MCPSAAAPFQSVFHRINLLPAWKRLAIGLLPAGLLFGVVPAAWPLLLRLLVAWDGFALSTLLLTWAIMLTAEVSHIRRVATREDPGRVLSFSLLLLVSSASLVAVVLVLSSIRSTHNSLLLPHVVVGVGGVLTAWVLVHTLFTLRYAHLYYGDGGAGQPAGGLEFPGGENQPDYLDFAYFSFVVGMTAQTADVGISGRTIRRVVLLHGVLSFGFNTAVVALTINGLAGVL